MSQHGLHKKTKAEKVVFTNWVHRSLGVVIQGDINDVDNYFAIRESGWPEDMQELILAGKVEIGMTTHMVFYAWGRPDSIKEEKTSDGMREHWTYKKQGSRVQYLYFENGQLRSIEQ